jgi:hypothetical protein
MDFIFSFPKLLNTEHDGCLGITCRFSNRTHLFPCKETLTAADFARLFIERYIPLHGVPNLIISDRDPKFISAFWSTIKAHLGLKHSMSTTDHPQTDGLQERMFHRTNQLLRTLVSTQHDDWEQFVPLVEFHLNSTPRRGLDKTPFEIDLGYQPTLSFATKLLQHEGARHAAADELMELFLEMDAVIRNTIQEICEDQNSRSSAGRCTPKFVAGDMVYLKTNHLKAFQNKLAPRWLGPLKILAALKYDTYKLEIPERFKKMHPIVHVSKLKEAHIPEHSPRKPANIDPLFDEPDDTPAMESIVDHRLIRNKMHFRVRFVDLSPAHDQWVPTQSVTNPTLIKKYWAHTQNRAMTVFAPLSYLTFC